MLSTTRMKFTLSAVFAFLLLTGCNQANNQTVTVANPSPAPAYTEAGAVKPGPSSLTASTPTLSTNSASLDPASPSISSPIPASPSPSISPPNPASPSSSAAGHITVKPATSAASSSKPPKNPPDHIVIVIEENHSYNQIIGNSTDAPFIQSLVKRGALFTNAHGITHPSQPNYLALFSGSMQGITNDACTKPFSAPNLASSLIAANLTFTGYSESLPKAGFTGCSTNGYARKHNPWVQFTNVPAQANQPFSSFPDDFTLLPTVSIVVPSMEKDMHDGTILEADHWLRDNMERYVSWAEKHNSMLILTWDEDNFAKANHIPLILAGAKVKTGIYDTEVNHFNVLRTIEELYQLPYLGESKHVPSIFYSLN